MNTLIVTDKATLNRLVTTTLTTKAKYEALLHGAALSVMYHAMVHGDCSVMNRLFFGLNANEQTAFRFYWKRLSWEIIGKPDINLAKYVSSESADDYGFTVLNKDQNPNAPAWREAAVAFIRDRLASDKPGNWKPDATGDATTAKPIVPFYATNNVRDNLTDFGDRNLFKQVRQMVKVSTSAKAPGGGDVKVSRAALVEIEKCLAALDRIVNNDATVARDKEEAKAAKASPRKTARASNRKAPPAQTAATN
jgi:hypothetical protein